MDENITPEQEPQETDWEAKYKAMQAHSREWEKKAKANKAAADELEKLKAEQLTEQEKEKARADKAEAELAELKAAAAKHDAAQVISKQTGVPSELLDFCADEDAMREFAEKYTAETVVASAPSALSGSRIIRGNDEKKPNSQVFAEFAKNLF